MRRNGGADEAVALEFADQRLGLFKVFGVVFCPGRGEADHDSGDRAAKPRRAEPLGSGLREEVVVGSRRHAPRGHFETREPRALAHEFRTHELSFGGPDLLREPVHEGKVGAEAAHEIHGGMGMQIDEAREERALRKGNDFRGAVLRARFGNRKQIDDPAVGNHDGGVLKNDALRGDRNDPAGLNDRICVEHFFSLLWKGKRRQERRRRRDSGEALSAPVRAGWKMDGS